MTQSAQPHLFWIHTVSLPDQLDSATWLDTTQALRSMGWQVTLISSGSREGTASLRGIYYTVVSKPNVYFLGQLLYHLKLSRRILSNWRNIDIILFHQMSSFWMIPLRLLSLFLWKRPLFVLDTRTLPMEHTENLGLKDRLRVAFFMFVTNYSRLWVDGQLAITEPMAEAIKIPPRQYWGVWPSGVDAERFQDVQTERHWPQAGDPVRYVYVGALSTERNLLGFCRALEQANAEGIPCEMLIVGGGTQEADLKALAATSEGRIQMLPPVPHDQIPELLMQAHIGVLPFPDEQRFNVSSPIKLFEYLASGLVIYSTKLICITNVTGDHPDIFWAKASEDAAFLAAIREVHQQRDRLPEIGAEMQSLADKWTWGEAAKKLARGLQKGLAQFGRAEGNSLTST